MCLHYGRSSSRAEKVYLSGDGKVLGFRPRDNFARKNRSAKRLVMPEFDTESRYEDFREW
jgi:branched-chain amino acid aminotransferase